MPNHILAPFKQVEQLVQDSFIRDLDERRRALVDGIIRARKYDDGVHNTKLTDRQSKFLQVGTDADFTVNYCPMVVNAKADRLKVTGFDTDDPQQDTLWKWWRHNRMDRTQGIVHRAAIRDGDAYVLVEWDKEANMPRFYYEPAYTGDGVMVYYSEERREDIEYASKQWRIKYGPHVGKMRRLNLYFPDRIEKYVSHDEVALGGWQPFLDDTTIEMPGKLGVAGVNWWTDTGAEGGTPLGIPIVHFKNDDNGDGYGTSSLKKVMPVQDAVNKAMIDLLGAMDVAGFGLLVGYGADWGGTKVAPGAIAHVNIPPNLAKLERLAAENPQGLLSVYNALVMEIGRISGTPLSYFQQSGQVAAEGTMKQQEIALITQVEKSQTDLGNSWEDCLKLARRLHNAFGEGDALDTDAIIDTVWQEAETRNDKAQAEVLEIRVDKLGVSEEQAQIEIGYDATQRASFARAKLTAQARTLRRGVTVPPVDNGNGDETLTQTEGETNGTTPASAAA